MRSDGREPEDLRVIRIEAGVLERADGSARVEWGLQTKQLLVPISDEPHIRELKEKYYIKVLRTPPSVEMLKHVFRQMSDVTDPERVAEYVRGLPLDAVYRVRDELKSLINDGKKITDSTIKQVVDKERTKTHTKSGETIVVDVPSPLYDKLKELRAYDVIGEGFRGNIAVVAVYGPREPIPRHVGDPYRATIRFRYVMAPFSVPERKRPAPGRREIEISKVCGEALQKVVFAEEFPMTAIDVFAELLSADAGTRVTALTAAAVALADAGIPMRDLVSALAVGKIPVEGKETVVADLTKFEEDLEGAVDIPLAVMPRSEEVVLLQMDGRISVEQLEEAVELGIRKAREIYELQKNALKEKYRRVIENE